MSLKTAYAAAAVLRPLKLTLDTVLPLHLLGTANDWASLAGLTQAATPVVGKIHRPTMLRRLMSLADAGLIERRQKGNHFTVEFRMTAAGKRLVTKLDKIGAEYAKPAPNPPNGYCLGGVS